MNTLQCSISRVHKSHRLTPFQLNGNQRIAQLPNINQTRNHKVQILSYTGALQAKSMHTKHIQLARNKSTRASWYTEKSRISKQAFTIRFSLIISVTSFLCSRVTIFSRSPTLITHESTVIPATWKLITQIRTSSRARKWTANWTTFIHQRPQLLSTFISKTWLQTTQRTDKATWKATTADLTKYQQQSQLSSRVQLNLTSNSGLFY